MTEKTKNRLLTRLILTANYRAATARELAIITEIRQS
jgi:hypothetical protein